jgi:hypothetical protein
MEKDKSSIRFGNTVLGHAGNLTARLEGVKKGSGSGIRNIFPGFQPRLNLPLSVFFVDLLSAKMIIY